MDFKGRVTIKVRFHSKIEYEKFRKYILKTKWSYDQGHPLWEELTMDFQSIDDINQINTHVIYLLQMGFEVYCCRYVLERHLAEIQHPPEGDMQSDISGEPEIGEWWIGKNGGMDLFAFDTTPKVEE